MAVIYKIVNTLNSKMYIGSSKNFKNRKMTHLRTLRKGKHHNIYLQRSFDKYGESAFIFEIIETCDNQFDREKYWIDKLSPEYNIGAVGGGDNYTNHPNKEELRLKLVKILEEAPRASLFRERNPNWRGGTTFCSCGARISPYSKCCSKCRDRTGKNNPFYGKKHTGSARAKWSKAKSGKGNMVCRKPIYASGFIFPSATIAARALNISNGLVTYRVNKDKYDYYYLNLERLS